MKIVLRKYQQEALIKLLSTQHAFLCAVMGSGKTIITLMYLRALLKRNKIDKAIIGCTVSSVGVYEKEFKEKAKINITIANTPEELIDFLKGKSKIVVVKHSLLEKIGTTESNLASMNDFFKADFKKVALILDEAHKLSNPESLGNFAICNLRKFFSNIVIATATPYSSNLQQLYGLIKLIRPNQWKSLKDFRSKYVQSDIIKDWKTGKYLRTEDIAYINLSNLRRELEEFTFFHFPKINITYHTHKTQLQNNNQCKYDELCKEIHTEMKSRVNNNGK